MKKQILSIVVFLFAFGSLFSQEPEPYNFKEYKVNEATSVKNQQNTGTCWSFSSASFLESELIRMGKGNFDLSEMYVVRHIYRMKAENYVRRQGNARLSEGGLAHDLLNAVDMYGIVPQSVYPGKTNSDGKYDHSELESHLISMCDEFVTLGKKGKLPNNWLEALDSYLDGQFGEVPASFMHMEKSYTPKTFLAHLGIVPSNYVNITSFTHHRLYSQFILEIPDNFSNGSYYNVPLDEMVRTMNFALKNDYTMVWDGDVSNTGFAAKYGMAVVPEIAWVDKSEVQKKNSFKYYEKEQYVDQKMRQKNFDSQVTTDDHLMHLTGILSEEHGTLYYVIKNSWGEISDLKGYIYASEPYIRMNTVAITVHIDAIPTDLKERLGLKKGTGAVDTSVRDKKNPKYKIKKKQRRIKE